MPDHPWEREGDGWKDREPVQQITPSLEEALKRIRGTIVAPVSIDLKTGEWEKLIPVTSPAWSCGRLRMIRNPRRGNRYSLTPASECRAARKILWRFYWVTKRPLTEDEILALQKAHTRRVMYQLLIDDAKPEPTEIGDA